MVNEHTKSPAAAYWSSLTIEGKNLLAVKCKTNRTYLGRIMNGTVQASEIMALTVAYVSDCGISPYDLRPDIDWAPMLTAVAKHFGLEVA